MILPGSGLTLGYTLEHLISFKETRPTQQLLCAAGKGRDTLRQGLMFCVPLVS